MGCLPDAYVPVTISQVIIESLAVSCPVRSRARTVVSQSGEQPGGRPSDSGLSEHLLQAAYGAAETLIAVFPPNPPPCPVLVSVARHRANEVGAYAATVRRRGGGAVVYVRWARGPPGSGPVSDLSNARSAPEIDHHLPRGQRGLRWRCKSGAPFVDPVVSPARSSQSK